MRDFAIVKSIDGQRIEVVSLISDACVTCGSIECARKGKSFRVINKKNLPLSENSIIRIGFPRALRGFLGIVSLFLPISAAAGGLLVSPLLLGRLALAVTQRNQALTAGAFFAAAALVVLLISRTDIHLTYPEALQVM